MGRRLGIATLMLVGGLAAAADRVIAVHDDHLTVRLSNVPVTDVLDEIGQQTGAEIRGQVRNDRDVTSEFDDVPLSEGLHRLLGDQNFALVYGGGGALRTVKLLGGPVTTTATTLAPGEAPAGPDLAALVAEHGPVNLYGDLAEAVGPTSSLQDLFDVAMRHNDPAVRAEAIRTMVGLLETEPALRGALVSQMDRMGDAAVTSLLRRAAGSKAEDVATQILAQTRGRDLRTKASAILQRLRNGT